MRPPSRDWWGHREFRPGSRFRSPPDTWPPPVTFSLELAATAGIAMASINPRAMAMTAQLLLVVYLSSPMILPFLLPIPKGLSTALCPYRRGQLRLEDVHGLTGPGEGEGDGYGGFAEVRGLHVSRRRVGTELEFAVHPRSLRGRDAPADNRRILTHVVPFLKPNLPHHGRQ